MTHSTKDRCEPAEGAPLDGPANARCLMTLRTTRPAFFKHGTVVPQCGDAPQRVPLTGAHPQTPSGIVIETMGEERIERGAGRGGDHLFDRRTSNAGQI
jgi:hypothetical protein